jgi:hypothetical protein
MTNTLDPRRIKRSIMALLNPKKAAKHPTTYDRRPDDYFGNVWIKKDYYEAIDFISHATHTSRKKVTEELLQRGFSKYIGEQIHKNNLMIEEERRKGQREYPTYFIARLRHWAKQKGFNIGKFV